VWELSPSSASTWPIFRPTSDEGLGSKFARTNLDPFEANWFLELDLHLSLTCILVLQITSSPLRFLFFIFGSNHLILPPKHMPCRFSLSLCHFRVLHPHLRPLGSTYGCGPIGLLYFIELLLLDPHLKWPLRSLHLASSLGHTMPSRIGKTPSPCYPNLGRDSIQGGRWPLSITQFSQIMWLYSSYACIPKILAHYFSQLESKFVQKERPSVLNPG
jgi:hypothetical protein